MATRKAAGSAKNLTDSQPKYLGLKKGSGQFVKSGNILVRQRGSKYLAGKNVGVGKDYTLFALKDGKVSFSQKRKIGFNKALQTKKVISVV